MVMAVKIFTNAFQFEGRNTMSSAKKVVIVGGVAGGASAAARARRLSEDAEIIIIERGPSISYANCGMPYYIGGVIADRKRLLVQTAENMRQRFRIDVRVNTEALAIDRSRRVLKIRDLASAQEKEEHYDVLILSPGAEPIKPPLPGIDLPGVFTLRSLQDMDQIRSFLDNRKARRSIIVGGGFIGLEMAEAFRERGLEVVLVEMAQQVLNQLDPEMAAPVHQQLEAHGVALKLGASVNGFHTAGEMIATQLSTGEVLQADLVVLAIGVRPEVKLAREADLEIGAAGGITVDEHLRTSDPTIYAVGDAVETLDIVAGQMASVPLAGPANRQGRIAADNALGQPASVYRGSQGTAICKIFDLVAGSTGLNEKMLKRLGRPYQKIYIHPASHAGYYPGAQPMSLKLLYHPKDGKILGTQVVGTDGVDKRLDVLATALRGNMTVFDLEHLELAYAPPYGSAKDPVNYAGFVAANALRGDVTYCHTEEMVAPSEHQLLLDVRTPSEVAAGTIPGALNISVDSLRERLTEIPREKELLVFCQVGLRSYLAARILNQHGWKTKVLTGGYTTYQAVVGASAGAKAVAQREVRNDANAES
jgi:NADPH-dependent 2,4-dienoyl-CoA reductase/sulfur reductase-like enzyme/rhodanese-related sulfurtransferase